MSQVLVKGISNTPFRLDVLSTFLLLCPIISKKECLETDRERNSLYPAFNMDRVVCTLVTWLLGNKKLGM